MFEQTYFHISDEPHGEQMETYRAAKESIWPLLADCHVIDALSSFTIYQAGVVEHPIVCNDFLEPFLEAGVENLWTYYCCVQGHEVSNQFMAMPSARNRILGVQLYLYRMKGFLHWGYNFYNSQHSVSAVNPYLVTDAGGGFPSGDPFVVYPAKDGTPYESLRFMVFTEAMYDLRAFERLEELAGREYVERLIHEGLEYRITFKKYPKDAEYLLRLREKVNCAIDEKNGKRAPRIYEALFFDFYSIYPPFIGDTACSEKIFSTPEVYLAGFGVQFSDARPVWHPFPPVFSSRL